MVGEATSTWRERWRHQQVVGGKRWSGEGVSVVTEGVSIVWWASERRGVFLFSKKSTTKLRPTNNLGTKRRSGRVEAKHDGEFAALFVGSRTEGDAH